MRVVLIIGGLTGGGAEHQFKLLASGLVSRGHVVHAVVFSVPGQDGELLESAGVQVHLVRSGDGFLRSQARLTRLLRLLKADIVYAFLEASCLRASLAKWMSGSPQLVWGIRNSGVELRHYPLRVRGLRILLPLLSPLCDLAISNSEAGVAYSRRLGVRPRRIRRIANGITRPAGSSPTANRSRLRHQWGIPGTDFVFGLLARNDPMKGVDTFLQAANITKMQNSKVSFVIAGTGHQNSDRPDTEFSSGTTFVRFVGNVNPWDGFFDCIDVLVSSSRFGEGFSNSIAEALLAGKPVISTDIGEARTIVGGHGLIIGPDDPARLSQAMKTLMNTEEDPTKSSERTQWVQDNFGVEKMVVSTETELLKLIPRQNV